MRRLFLPLLLLAALHCRAEIPLRVSVDALHEDVAARVVAGRIDSVLADADRYLRTQERLSDGRWKLAILYGGLDIGFNRAADSPERWNALSAALAAAARRHPDSPNVWPMRAQLESSHAWAIRGEGYASTVDAASMQEFHDHIALEQEVLKQHRVPNNPVWHELRIQAAGGAGASQADLDRLFDAGLAHAPGYQHLWYARLDYMLPQWGGSLEAMAAFINRGGAVTSPTEGRGMMARLLEIASELGEHDLINSPAIDWNSVKASYDDVLQRYPDDWNSQWYFFEACQHGDKPAAQHLLGFVKEPPSPALLNRNVDMFQTCAAWAKGKIPGFLMRDHETGRSRLIE